MPSRRKNAMKPSAEACLPDHSGASPAFAVVVNDDTTQRLLLAGLVRRAGLEPVACSEAEAALAVMDRGAPPALIVTELYMPGIDGWRFCRLLRSPDYPAFNRVPIIVVSATYTGEEPDRIAADLGAEAFLPSPVDGRRFVEQVRAILCGGRARAPLHALIVEDSRTLAFILQKALEAHGYAVDTAHTVREAVEAFARVACDVAVLDYHLPDGTGATLLDAFHAERPGCVCLMMTTDPGPELALDWMKRGAAAYLRKPFQPEYLIELCTRARRERSLLHVQDLLETRTRQLRESETAQRMLLDGMLDVISTHSPDSTFRYVAPSCMNMLGYPPEALIGRRALDFVHPEDREATLAAIADAVGRQALSYRAQYRLRQADGEYLWTETVSRLVYEANELREIRCTTRDIAERKRLQTQLAQAQKMESVGRLAGGVAHDFNNMLNVILGYAELAQASLRPEDPVQADLVEIRKAAERSADLTRQLLGFARRQAITPRVLDLNASVEGMLRMLRRLVGENIDLAWRPGTGRHPVKIDPTQVDQILANLCINARDAVAGEGRITIETGTVRFDDDYCALHPGHVPGEYVMLAVSDTGRGMSREVREHLFEPFFTTKDIGRGTGLGLATVYGIVRQNNGFINVHSEPGQGASFWIHLPRHLVEDEPHPSNRGLD